MSIVARWGMAILLLTHGTIGCGSTAPGQGSPPPTAQHAATIASRTPAAPAPLRVAVRPRPELDEHFRAERVSGTIALYDTAGESLSCSDVPLCEKPTIPASTFKIAHSMIALETGVLDHAESVLPWDKREYPVAEWNQDHTLRSAVRVSCAPCFQGIARKIGATRMKEWLDKLEYGNRDLSGGIDQFWLNGGLRISPLQQIEFLRRFEQGKLPISSRTADTVRDILTLEVGRNHVLVGKTGLNQPPDFPELAAWFVGWLELGERRIYFATRITGHENGVDVKPARRAVTERVLRALKLLPEAT